MTFFIHQLAVGVHKPALWWFLLVPVLRVHILCLVAIGFLIAGLDKVIQKVITKFVEPYDLLTPVWWVYKYLYQPVYIIVSVILHLVLLAPLRAAVDLGLDIIHEHMQLGL